MYSFDDDPFEVQSKPAAASIPALYDLHCDTIHECLVKGQRLYQNSLQIDAARAHIGHWIQTFSFWIHDRYQGEEAFDRFLAQYALLMAEVERLGMHLYDGTLKEGVCNVMLAVEGGHLICGMPARIPLLKRRGVHSFMPVWNQDNSIVGCSRSDMGLTWFGRLIIKEMDEYGLIADVSHMSKRGFYDLYNLSTKPFIASHSNARAICDHPRNLDDDQIKAIIERGGLCGINFYPTFLSGKKDATLEDFRRHVEHILVLGGADILAVGSDFDGAAMPSVLPDISHIGVLYQAVVGWYGERVAKKMFYENAKTFMDKNVFGK